MVVEYFCYAFYLLLEIELSPQLISKYPYVSLSQTSGLLISRGHFSDRKSYRQESLVGNKIIDHSDVVGASPVGAAPTTSSFST